jgi:hypothetical protein
MKLALQSLMDAQPMDSTFTFFEAPRWMMATPVACTLRPKYVHIQDRFTGEPIYAHSVGIMHLDGVEEFLDEQNIQVCCNRFL